ncbi:hypothetical protein CYMTET_49529 [Cymbomonas tetramitiformis]|uniref:J domain-containing protein n=2 Tax=Cymbomonas tetramitiformis TaxID=36881 RepID=A0AAE0BR55_9CHLO|nr:hypothetical protein CYMTET_49529 [Cymbomonas tetramitiformis]
MEPVSALEGNCVSRGAEVMDYYQVLGLSFDQRPSADQIRRAYHEQARRSHPDKNQHNPAAVSHFQAVQAAYSTLSCPTKRQTYDATCQQASRQPPRRPYPSQAPQPQGHSARPQSAFTPRYTAVWSDAVSYRMSCGKCAGYHMWQPTARFPHEARWCPCCATHHEALEGEGWAEHPPSIFSFLSRAPLPTGPQVPKIAVAPAATSATHPATSRGPPGPGASSMGQERAVRLRHACDWVRCAPWPSVARGRGCELPAPEEPGLVEALPDSLLVRLLKQPLQGGRCAQMTAVWMRARAPVCAVPVAAPPADGSAPLAALSLRQGLSQVRISGLDSRTEYIVRTRQGWVC